VIDRILGFKCEPSERLSDFLEIVERWKSRILFDELALEDVVKLDPPVEVDSGSTSPR
jgi:hypothetical protein